MNIQKNKSIAALPVMIFLSAIISAQTTAFSYQGHLNNGGAPANGNYEMQFKLFVDPGAISAGGVCTFRIGGGKPNAKVSWEVKGVRNDRFVRTYGCAVETEKAETERGKYQHPELYGLPKEMGMNYRPEPERAEPDRATPERPSQPPTE